MSYSSCVLKVPSLQKDLSFLLVVDVRLVPVSPILYNPACSKFSDQNVTHVLDMGQENCVHQVFTKTLLFIHKYAPAQNIEVLLPLNSCRTYINNSAFMPRWSKSTLSLFYTTCSNVCISRILGAVQFLFEFLPTSLGLSQSQL